MVDTDKNFFRHSKILYFASCRSKYPIYFPYKELSLPSFVIVWTFAVEWFITLSSYTEQEIFIDSKFSWCRMSYSLDMQCELLKEKYFLKHFFISFLIWFANRTRCRGISALVQFLYIFLEIAHELRGDRTLIRTILWK